MQPLQEIWSDFAHFSYITKMPLVPSNMDGFQILKILLVALIKDYHIMCKNGLSPQYKVAQGPFTPNFSLKYQYYVTLKL